MTRPFAAAAALAVAALFVSPVSAGAPSGPSWDAGYRVAYGDLELGTIEGGDRLDRRIDRASRTACGDRARLIESQCREAFRNEAIANLPVARRDDYARSRSAGIQARAAVVAR